jgi:hypothetical protein
MKDVCCCYPCVQGQISLPSGTEKYTNSKDHHRIHRNPRGQSILRLKFLDNAWCDMNEILRTRGSSVKGPANWVSYALLNDLATLSASHDKEEHCPVAGWLVLSLERISKARIIVELSTTAQIRTHTHPEHES